MHFLSFLLPFVIIIQSRHPIHIQTHAVSLHFTHVHTHVHTHTHTHMVFGYCWCRADGAAPYPSKLSDTHHLTQSRLSLFSSLSLSNLVTLELRENLLKSLPSWVFSHPTAVIRSTVVMLWIYTTNKWIQIMLNVKCLDHSLALFPSWLNWNSWIWAAMYWKFW